MASWMMQLRRLSERYGKVAVGVHFTVSAASTTAFYLAIKSNVDMTPVMEALGIQKKQTEPQSPKAEVLSDAAAAKVFTDEDEWKGEQASRQSQQQDKVASAIGTGSALTLALLCNKALFPVRVPITLALTPPVARFLSRAKLHKS